MGWGVPYLLPWALKDTRKSHFKEKSKKKVPWAVVYQNDGLRWISPELVCPSRTSECGGEGYCVKEGGGEEGDRERDRAGEVRLHYSLGY